ncbi:cytochrome c biogenesis protein ResB [Niallia sp. NCCP-28]|uniref:cytochrome c biogenesis protein ResB n=1 Tax=Niallia sp. NCCP-28 TaxID=2934712 RepID=UPI002087DDDD|nr:cytochrome c biogenesis protein ResB [Niallia sp. NCCP-28]GKU81054.1 cytochrome c biogenesis protein [Niallia sp. NCCP-28]
MKPIQCGCGYKNPYGTEICCACGHVLGGNGGKVDMRYEGSARRSQTYKRTLIDKLWNFFSSVKVGVGFIVLVLVASIIGTILPQVPTIQTALPLGEYYKQNYGWFGAVYHTLGFSNLYHSFWYLFSIICLSISLLIASIDRFFPLYRSLKYQRVIKHPSFFKNQHVFFQLASINEQELEWKLQSLRYRVKKEKENVLAEKGRFSRWGPYVNHLGLIIFLIGVIARFLPGMYVNEVVWIRDGETKRLPGTNGEYYLKNNQFIVEVYDKTKEGKVFEDALKKREIIAKTFQTKATLFQTDQHAILGEKPILQEVKKADIEVNKPLKYDGYALYQGDYKLNELSKLEYKITETATNKEFGSIKINLADPQKSYTLHAGLQVEIEEYYPDVAFDKLGKPRTVSKIPNNPAFVFRIHSADKKVSEVSFATVNQTVNSFKNHQFTVKLENIKTKNVTALTVKKDPLLPILFIGGIIFMLGVIQGSYWNHRRVWIKKVGDQKIWIAAHTNKNWHGLKRDIEQVFGIIEKISLEKPAYKHSGTRGEE